MLQVIETFALAFATDTDDISVIKMPETYIFTYAHITGSYIIFNNRTTKPYADVNMHSYTKYLMYLINNNVSLKCLFCYIFKCDVILAKL